MNDWNQETARYWDSEEAWARGAGEFDYAVFCQGLARGLRSGQLRMHHEFSNCPVALTVGGLHGQLP